MVHAMPHFITGNIKEFPVHYGLSHVFSETPNTLMGNFTNNIDPDEMPQNAGFHLR